MNTILVALDGSPRAAGVLERAVAVGRSLAGQIVLMRSVGIPAEVPRELWKVTEEPLLEHLRRGAGDYLASCEARVPAEMRGGTRVVVGAPWQAICETAHGLAADLVVIGSHGYSGIDRLLGTTAAKVVNHASCSVLVVREPAR
jgi:nucleotide-binding universal stress UspA family protein